MAAPTVGDDQLLLVVDREAPAAGMAVIPFTWLKVVGIDCSTPYRGIAVVNNNSNLQSLPENVAVYRPASRRFVNLDWEN